MGERRKWLFKESQGRLIISLHSLALRLRTVYPFAFIVFTRRRAR